MNADARRLKNAPPRRQGTKKTNEFLGVLASWRRILSAFICVHLWLILFSSSSNGAWFDANWPYRRPIDVTWDADHASGDELATAEFYSDGHCLPNGDDLRVATDDGKLVATHILMNGPGDRIRLVFSLQKGIKKYAVYFGNPKPTPPPAGMETVKFQAGLMIETKQWNGGPVNDFGTIEDSWTRSEPSFGQAMIPNPFLGYNPFGEQDRTISKIVGSLFAPLNGNYVFAMSVDDAATLYIDNQPLLYAPIGPSDTRYHASIPLTRGRHDFLLYHVNMGGPGRFAVGWQRPNGATVEIISRESFGTCFGSQVGPMEQHDKPLIADFSATQVSECFFADNYSFRYHFTSTAKPLSAANYTWGFGDGQTSARPDLDHVYLTDGIYPVQLTIHIGNNTLTQSARIVVGRNFQNILNLVEDDPKVLAKIVGSYQLTKMVAESLSRTVMLYLRANLLDAAVAAANELADQKTQLDPAAAAGSLEAVDHELVNADRIENAISMWSRVPLKSDLQPRASKRIAQLEMWWTGDFGKAVQALEPFKSTADPSVRRIYAQALILNNQAEQGKKILSELSPQAPENRQAVLTGASARSVEFFIRENDPESGEESWERWQARYPTDFLEGYSVLLRTKLVEQRKRKQTAAKVAEAFAMSMPQSSYAPQLLDRASKLFTEFDPVKSQSIRQLLKQKYPEDPLSQ
jgi:hypothetical protein